MILIGLCGGIGHGKTTFANYLIESTTPAVHAESSDLIIELANALRAQTIHHPSPTDTAAINAWLQPLATLVDSQLHKQIPAAALQLTTDRLAVRENFVKLFEYLLLMQENPNLQSLTITANNKTTFRSLLQWLGGYLVKAVDEGIWFDELIHRLQVQPELRLAVVGGLRFPGDAERIRRAGGKVVAVQRPTLVEVDMQDLTERERNLIEPDSEVSNDSTLNQLEVCAQQLLKDVIQSTLHSRYRASAATLL